MKRPTRGSTVKQFAYAQMRLTGQGETKKEIARKVGYSPTVANNARNKIETTEGYQNAVIELAAKSNNVVLKILAEFESRDLGEYSNKDLNGALNAIGGAWEKFNKVRAPNDPGKGGNPLRKVLLQRVENQTIINNPPAMKEAAAEEVATAEDPGF